MSITSHYVINIAKVHTVDEFGERAGHFVQRLHGHRAAYIG